jgi:streptogramin lyase
VSFGNYAVVVTPAQATIDGASTTTLHLDVAVTGPDGEPVPNPDVSWATTRPSIATVSPSGLVQAITNGSVTVAAIHEGVAGLSTITITGLTEPVFPPGSVSTLGALFNQPWGVGVSPDGKLYVSVLGGLPALLLVDPVTADVSTVAGGTLSPGTVQAPVGIAVAPDGTIYLADAALNSILRVDPATLEVTVLAGGPAGFADGVGEAAQFNSPGGLALAPDGRLYVADRGNHRIRQVDVVTGDVGTLAGSDAVGSGDGLAGLATFDDPSGIAAAPDGMLYVVDAASHVLRRIEPGTGEVLTVAGEPYIEEFVDGAGPLARFASPRGVAVTPDGVVYVTDRDNQSVRKMHPGTFMVSTVAGNGFAGFADGIGPAASFDGPRGIAAAPSGSLFVADLGNGRIRRLDP